VDTQFQDIFTFNLGPAEALTNLSVALFCGILVALLYRITYKGISYSAGYVVSIIMLTLITALVIMVIGNNLARAFGLVGAMSIIRFRTAVKDTQDIMFIFFALALGLACGSGAYAIAITGTFFIGAVILVASWLNDSVKIRREYLVQVIFKNQQHPETLLNKIFSTHCRKHKLINIKKVGESDLNLTEYSYYIVLKNINKAVLFAAELNKVDGVSKVNVFFDEV
jgi:uncharacterized membrane protein YhiD involved in acid resistance